MHDPVAQTGAWVKQMLQGYPNYYAASGNHPNMWWFCNQVQQLWLKDALAPKAEGPSFLGALHPPRRTLPSANQDTTSAALPSLRRQNPREEPGALAALAGIWAGCTS